MDSKKPGVRGKGRAKPRRHGEPCSMAFLIRCMTDESLDIRDRIDCAKTLIPYQHRKLPTMLESSGDGTKSINFIVL